MFKLFKTKVLSSIIVLVLVFGNVSAVFADSGTIGQTYTATENGITYFIQQTQSRDKTSVSIKSSNSKDYRTYTVDKKSQTLTTVEYDYQGTGFLGAQKYHSTSNSFDCSNYDAASIDSVQLQAISYDSTVTDKLHKKYSYTYGSEGAKSYLKIKCVATYLIRTDNLSQTKDDNCDDYSNYILQCNSAYKKFEVASAAGGFATGFIIGILIGVVAVNIAFPPSLIVTLAIALVGTFTGITTAIYYLIDAEEYYNKAKNKYVTIRTYGTKL